MTTDHLHTTPPKWPLRLLRFFLKKEYLEEIEGDMEEIFRDNIRHLSSGKAKRMYTIEILKLVRPVLMKNFEGIERLNQYGMFKNYCKVSVRGLMKNPLNSAINLIGLSLSIGFSVFGYAFAQWTFKTDQFHKNKDVVFLTTFFADRDGTLQQYGTAPRPLGEMLRQDFAQVKKVCRLEDRNAVVKHEDRVFNERIRHVDPEFLEMLTFPMKWGMANSLNDINSIILSEGMAVKYFGEANPIGQSILLKFSSDNGKVFKITGVAEKFPDSRTIDFGFLVNFKNLNTSDPGYDNHDWSAFVRATLIQVGNPNDIKAIEAGMISYKQLQNEAVKEDWAIRSFGFEPLSTLHKRSEYIRDDISRSSSSNYTSIYFMVGIAILLLVLACFNYINMAIVTAAKRLKEIGVRKSIGASRRVVIVQFLTENVVITFFALILGLLFGWIVIIPWFETLWNFSLDFKLTDPLLWIYLPAVLLITGIASGIYPAFYVSRFQVVNILKGSVKFGTNRLTKALLGIQLVLSCFFITSALLFTWNADYLGEREWGYSNRDVLYAVVQDKKAYEQLETIMSRDPQVLSTSGSVNHVGKNHTTAVLHFPENEREVDVLAVDANYFKTLGIEVTEGRSFHAEEGSDRQSVVVNERLVRDFGWEDAIGKSFRIDSTAFEVIGVVKEFYSFSFKVPVKPAIFRVAEKENYRYLSMKVRKGSEVEVYKTLQAGWTTLFPETPFSGGYQEDVWGFYYQEIEIYGHVWRVFAFSAILLTTLGLYGLVRLNVSGRVREFSIRKVMGAGLHHIAATIARQYFVLVGVALLIGIPLSHYLSKALIQFGNEIHMPINYEGVSVATLILILIVLVTLATQVVKVAKDNPVEGLKSE